MNNAELHTESRDLLAPVNRVRTIPEVINDAIDLVRQNMGIIGRRFITTVMIPLVIGQTLASLFYERAMGIIFSRPSLYGATGVSTGSDSADLLLALVGLVLLLVGSAWGIALCNALVLAAYRSQDEGVELTDDLFAREYGDLRSKGLSGLLGLGGIGIGIVVVFIFVMGMPVIGFLFALVAVFLLPYLMVRYSLFFPAFLLEENSFFASFYRSGDMVRGAWWRTFGLLMTGFLLVVTLSMAGYMPLLLIEIVAGTGLLPTSDPGSLGAVGLRIFFAILYGIGQSFGIITHLFLAFHFLSRREAIEVTSIRDEIQSIGGVESSEPGVEW